MGGTAQRHERRMPAAKVFEHRSIELTLEFYSGRVAINPAYLPAQPFKPIRRHDHQIADVQGQRVTFEPAAVQ